MKMASFEKICAMIAVVNLYNSGVSIKEIAIQSKKSETTIRKWLKNANL
jgi:transposase